jgi:hypothetical protein
MYKGITIQDNTDVTPKPTSKAEAAVKRCLLTELPNPHKSPVMKLKPL